MKFFFIAQLYALVVFRKAYSASNLPKAAENPANNEHEASRRKQKFCVFQWQAK